TSVGVIEAPQSAESREEPRAGKPPCAVSSGPRAVRVHSPRCQITPDSPRRPGALDPGREDSRPCGENSHRGNLEAVRKVPRRDPRAVRTPGRRPGPTPRAGLPVTVGPGPAPCRGAPG